ncbi:hypothetical protein UT300003_13380 [Clostridium sardiniense]
MKKIVAFIMSLLVIICSINIPVFAANNESKMDKDGKVKIGYNIEKDRKINFTDNWKFKLGDESGAEAKDFNDSKWRSLNLPHDWSIELDFNKNSPATHEAAFLDGGVGWYRKTFKLPESMKGKKINIDFDGVYMESTVYVNGQKVGEYQNGYTPFGFDITDNLKFDGSDNVIAVKVKNTQPSSRWYSGSGIYRNVYITATNKVHVAKYGTFVTTPNIKEDLADGGNVGVNIKTKISNESGENSEVTVTNKIISPNGHEVSKVESIEVLDSKLKEFNQNLKVKNPKLWGIYSGNIYKAVTEVIKDGKVIDTYETPFGFRYFKFDANKGFSINGKNVKLKGVCMHHDLGALGAAVNYSAVERQILMLKEMGVNAIRSTHNPASPEFRDICEKNGILLIDEAFDCWEQGKKTYDYHRFFKQYAERDIKTMVDSAKNSPAIIMWSIGNEIYDTNTSNGVQIAKNLVKWIKEIDTTRPTTIGEDKYRGSKVDGVANFQSSRDEIFNTVDVVGYNYSENVYDVHHKSKPEWKMYGSETSSAVRSRGVYLDPNNPNIVDNSNLQCSSYDNTVVGWGRSAEDSWIRDRDRQFIAGQFIWTGFDYLGEPTPFYGKYPAKSSYFGAIDTAGFKKDIFYFYQSQWSDKPMVHLLPHWNWKDGENVQVWAYSNADTVELFLNGKSLGERKFEKKTTNYGESYLETKDGKLHLRWDVPFKAGTLKAVAKKNGVVVAEEEIKTAGQAAGVKLTPDKRVISSNGKNLSFITVDIVDKNGVVVPTADNLVNFEVTGGKLVGVDNGNGASVERYKANNRKAFNGKVLAIIEPDKNEGSVTVKATAQGLDSSESSIYTINPEDMNKDKIVGFEKVVINIDKGNSPQLPKTIKAIYANNTEKDVNVTWDKINPEQYNKVGSFNVNGTVKGSDIKEKAVINVRDIVLVKPYSTVTKVGVAPKLPDEATVIYSDGKEVQSKVTWESIDSEKYSKEGSFIVYGKVDITDKFKAEARIRVTNKTEKVNIALYNSKAQGKAFASFTNPADDVNNINDGVISYDNNPANRWTNWQRTPRTNNEYIGVEWKENQNVDNINLYVYADNGCQAPKSLIVEYLDGHEWKKVSNMTIKPGTITNNMKHEIKFDKVNTNKIRVNMIPKDRKSLAITEMEIMDDVIVPNNTAKLSSISINGKEIEGFSSDKTKYDVELPYGSEIPKIKATAIDNATEAIILPTNIHEEAKILVTSEDGKVINIYKINFNVKNPLLNKVEVSSDKTNYTEDDIGDLNVNATLQNGEKIDLNNAKVEYVTSNKDVAVIKNGKINIVGEGRAEVSVKVTYKNVTKESNKLVINAKKSNKEKFIVGFEPIKVVVDKGEEPKLPKEVEAKYNIGLSRNKQVTWEKIKAEQYGKLGTFKVYGKVYGTSLKAVAEVEVKGEVAVESVSAVTLINEEPILPKTLMVYYSDNTERQHSVKWNKISQDKYGNVGEFIVEGEVKDSNLKAVAKVRVSDKFEKGLNISRFQNGYDYPRVQSSYSNEPPVSPTSKDKVEYIHNDIISFNDDPHDRWTNWKPNPDKTGWVSIEFGRTGPQEYYVNEMTVHYFKDSGIALPESAIVQYEKDDKWIDVKNQKVENGKNENTKIYKFDKIKASKVRIFMNAKANKSLGITEVQIFKDDVIKNSKSFAKEIKIGANKLKEFNPENMKYTINVDNNIIPEISAIGEDNAAVTVVEPVTIPGKGKVIVKGEDGVKTNVYELLFAKNIPIEKSGLNKKINDIKNMDLSKYTEGSKELLNNALLLAEKVLKSKDSTQDGVNNAAAMLDDAVKRLSNIEGNRPNVSTYKIEVVQGQNGKVSPNGSFEVKNGENQKFIFTPDKGYKVDEVLLNGKKVNVLDNSYVLKDINSNNKLEVIFKDARDNKDDKNNNTGASPSNGAVIDNGISNKNIDKNKEKNTKRYESNSKDSDQKINQENKGISKEILPSTGKSNGLLFVNAGGLLFILGIAIKRLR